MPKPKPPRPTPVVQETAPDVWSAGSRTRLNKFHVVRVHREYGVIGFTCTCEHFCLGRGKVCDHIRAVQERVCGEGSDGGSIG